VEKLKDYKWLGNVRALKTYLQNLYNDCLYIEQPYITVKMIEEHPPRNNRYHSNFGMLESLLVQYLNEWNPSKGKFMKDFIEPIVAKAYLVDLQGKYTKQEASTVLGIACSRGNDSTLIKRFNAYKVIADDYL